jgi:hypothetical protein
MNSLISVDATQGHEKFCEEIMVLGASERVSGLPNRVPLSRVPLLLLHWGLFGFDVHLALGVVCHQRFRTLVHVVAGTDEPGTVL